MRKSYRDVTEGAKLCLPEGSDARAKDPLLKYSDMRTLSAGNCEAILNNACL